MAFVKAQLFESRDRLADDVYEFSEAIDSLVERQVSLEKFLGSVAGLLSRAVEADVFGIRLKGLPGGEAWQVHRGRTRWPRASAK